MNVAELKQSIEVHETLLRAQKQELKALTKKENPFPTTKVGSFLFRSVVAITNPMRRANEEMTLALMDPKKWSQRRADRKGIKLLEACHQTADNQAKNAQRLATKAAMFLHKYEDVASEDIVSELKEHMERLRSDHSKRVKARMAEVVEEAANGTGLWAAAEERRWFQQRGPYLQL